MHACIISGGGVEAGHAVQEEVAEDQVEVLGLVVGLEVDGLVVDEQVQEDADPVAQGDEDLGLLVEVDRAYF
ncbi:unnamed protein product [Trifolium pratense]|uniref:Uncharacterized protein n=1 Tax=Trifolium pratense TaxID=57577 RepID=A0ACB0IRN6_TRIPR|nr:unnamed protein product [Trifolium pratense]